MRAQSLKCNLNNCLLIFVFFNFFALNQSFSQDIVKDSSFEVGHPNAYWQEQSTNFNGVICNYLCGNCSGKCVPRSGSYFVWLGGSSTMPENSEVSQEINFPNTNFLILRFYLKIPSITNNQTDVFYVQIDSSTIYTVMHDSAARFSDDYIPVDINISQFANESPHILKFSCYQSANPSSSSFLIDDVSIRFTSGMDEKITQLRLLEVYPNPAIHTLSVVLRSDYQGYNSYLIYAVGGEIVQKGIIPKNIHTFELDISKFPKGEYFLVIRDEKSHQQQTEKFLKQ